MFVKYGYEWYELWDGGIDRLGRVKVMWVGRVLTSGYFIL